LCGVGRAAGLDPLQLVIDVAGLGTSGFRAADWLRSHRQVDLHVCDHRRTSAQLSHAD
jgi:arginine decarboxylase